MTHAFRAIALLCILGTPVGMIAIGGFWTGTFVGAAGCLIGAGSTMLAELTE